MIKDKINEELDLLFEQDVTDVSPGGVSKFKYNTDSDGEYGPPGEYGPKTFGQEAPLILKFGNWNKRNEFRSRERITLVTGINLKYLNIGDVKIIAGPWRDEDGNLISVTDSATGEPTGEILRRSLSAGNGKERYRRFCIEVDRWYRNIGTTGKQYEDLRAAGGDLSEALLHSGSGSWRTYISGLADKYAIDADSVVKIASRLKNAPNATRFKETFSSGEIEDKTLDKLNKTAAARERERRQEAVAERQEEEENKADRADVDDGAPNPDVDIDRPEDDRSIEGAEVEDIEAKPTKPETYEAKRIALPSEQTEGLESAMGSIEDYVRSAEERIRDNPEETEEKVYGRMGKSVLRRILDNLDHWSPRELRKIMGELDAARIKHGVIDRGLIALLRALVNAKRESYE